jgi:hypothetical protein
VRAVPEGRVGLGCRGAVPQSPLCPGGGRCGYVVISGGSDVNLRAHTFLVVVLSTAAGDVSRSRYQAPSSPAARGRAPAADVAVGTRELDDGRDDQEEDNDEDEEEEEEEGVRGGRDDERGSQGGERKVGGQGGDGNGQETGSLLDEAEEEEEEMEVSDFGSDEDY